MLFLEERVHSLILDPHREQNFCATCTIAPHFEHTIVSERGRIVMLFVSDGGVALWEDTNCVLGEVPSV